MNNMQAALHYRDKGLSVIPIRPDKKPCTQWTEFQRRLATEAEIREWWAKWPKANVGIVTGEISGVFVVDCDNEEAYQKIQELLPDNFISCIVKSPRGYHIYLLYSANQTIGNATGIMPNVDIRGEGGYIIAPPSINAEGKAYSWMQGLSIDELAPAPVPDALLSALYNNINNSLYRGCCQKGQQTTTFDNIDNIFAEGKRDDNLYHLALSLAKTGNSREYIKQTLTAITSSWGEHDETWINAKVESAFKRISTQERNLTADIREFVLTTSGNFLTTDVYQMTTLTTREDKKKANVILGRLVEEGIIERYGDKNGCFRRVENNVEVVDFLNAPTDDFPLALPLGVSDYCKLYPGNIIIVAGSKSAGKTAFLLNIVKENMHRHEIVYLNSEMGDTEFRKRLELFDDPLSGWKFKAYHRSSGFSDLITPERVIFIVDFLEVTTDFWKVAQYIQEIHKKLKEGIAIIALQKADDKEAGRGGDFSKEKSRLYLSLDYLPEQKVNRIKIVDAKAWKTETNPRGMYRNYKLANGSRFFPVSNWEG